MHTVKRPARRQITTNPHFANILSEWMNTPISEIAKNTPERFTRPAVNVIEHKDHYVIAMALPGIEKKDLQIKIEEGSLYISSDIENKIEADFKLREFHYGKFNRSFLLPDNIDTEKIEASMDNGILTVRLHTIPETLPVKIEIK